MTRWEIRESGHDQPSGWFDVYERSGGIVIVNARVFGSVRAELVRDVLSLLDDHDHDWLRQRIQKIGPETTGHGAAPSTPKPLDPAGNRREVPAFGPDT